jgi:hypothetical protein
MKSIRLRVRGEALPPNRSAITPLLRSAGRRGSVSVSDSSLELSKVRAAEKSSSTTRSAWPSAAAISKMPAA